MNTRKLFKADNEGKLDEFLSSLTSNQIRLLLQQFKDELDRYKIVTKNYSKEKYEKHAQPFVDKRLNYCNKLYRQLTANMQGPK